MNEQSSEQTLAFSRSKVT